MSKTQEEIQKEKGNGTIHLIGEQHSSDTARKNLISDAQSKEVKTLFIEFDATIQPEKMDQNLGEKLAEIVEKK